MHSNSMDLALLLKESLLAKEPIQHNQFLNFHGAPHMVTLEVHRGHLKIKKIRKLHKKKQLRQHIKGKFRQIATRLQEFKRRKNKLSKPAQPYDQLNNAITVGTQTDPPKTFTAWTQAEERDVCEMAVQTEPIEMHAELTQTVTHTVETRSNQTEPEVYTRCNQTDCETYDKAQQTDWRTMQHRLLGAPVSSNGVIDENNNNKGNQNELLVCIVKQILQLTQDRNFQLNMAHIKHSLQLPAMLQQFENFGLRAYLEQRQNTSRKYRFWHKHNHYINIMKRQRNAAKLEDIPKIRSTKAMATQTTFVETATIACQSTVKRKRWSFFNYNDSAEY